MCQLDHELPGWYLSVYLIRSPGIMSTPEGFAMERCFLDTKIILEMGGAATTLIKLSNSKVAEKLIDKIARIQEIGYEPTRIIRAADAETEADKIRALGRIEINELERRALERMVREEGRYQCNIEAITSKAAMNLDEGARPEDIDDDWLVDFFAKCRTVGDDAMRELWAKLLSEEANNPDTFNRQVVSIVSTMGKSQAKLFERLCSYCWTWTFTTPLYPFVFDLNDAIYRYRSMTHSDISELESLGLLRLDSAAQFQLPAGEASWIRYQDRGFKVIPKENGITAFPHGHVSFTKAGGLLARVSTVLPIDGFVDYVAIKLDALGFILEEVPQGKR